MKPIIKVENLSKQYRLGNIGTGTIRDDFQRWLHRLQGKEDPFLKIGETNDRSSKGNSDYVWALKDINFEVMPGEVLGIIGKNGAGKSTLLKILSNVTGPTTGKISYNGRIGSLLEVGTGFHPELTGRENIFLNGAILGMTKREIKAKLDEIIDFSGCERYIDTPVKRYSSGMTVRLGFAVAAHLDPEILIVDEVLAVGDAEFQKKAIGKMQDVSRNEGRTVLFVSHNMGAIQKLCNCCLIIEKGNIVFDGNTQEAITYHLDFNNSALSEEILDSFKLDKCNINIQSLVVNGSSKRRLNISGDKSVLDILVTGKLVKEEVLCFEAFFYNEYRVPLFLYNPDFTNSELKTYQAGDFSIRKMIRLPEKMNSGKYFVDISITDPLKKFHIKLENALILECNGYANSSGFIYLYKDGGVSLIN